MKLHGGAQRGRRQGVGADLDDGDDDVGDGDDGPDQDAPDGHVPLRDRLRFRPTEERPEAVPAALLRQYIAYARQYVHPTYGWRRRSQPVASATEVHPP